jgi:FkbM family methyltransferase
MGLYEFFISHPGFSRSKLLVIMEKLTKRIGSIKVFEASGYERVVSAVMKRLLHENDISIDIGAHYGYHSVKMSEYVKNGIVFSFEPETDNFLELRKNTMNTRNIIISPLAISNSVGDQEMFISEFSSIHSLLYKPDRFKKTIPVKTNTLDNLFYEKTYVKSITLIKIDVEGSELNVLEGGKRILKENDIKIILEFFPKQWILAGIFSHVFDFLIEIGYKNFFDLNEHLRKVIKINNPKNLNEYEYFVDYTNLLCTK